VEVDHLRVLSISGPGEFAASRLPGAVVLDGVIVGPTLLESVESSALEAIENGSWLDVAAALPPEFPAGHVGSVVSLLDHRGAPQTTVSAPSPKSRAGKGSSKRKPSGANAAADLENGCGGRVAAKLDASIYRDQYLLSSSLLEKCWACLRSDADERAKRRASKLSELMAVVGVHASVCPPSAPLGEDADSSTAASKKGSKVRRRKDKSAAAPQKGGSDVSKRTVRVELPSTEEICALLEADSELMELLSADYLGNAPANSEELFLVVVEEGLGTVEGESIEHLYESAAEAAVAEMEATRVAAKFALEQSIVSGLENCELYNTNANTLSFVSDSAIAESRAHILSTVCVQTVLKVLEFVGAAVGVPRSTSSGISAVRDLSCRLPPDVASKTRAMVSAVASKNASDIGQFLDAYDDCIDALDLPPRRPLDKKRERAHNTALTASAGDTLSAASARADSVPAIDALQICAALLHARRTNGAMVALPPSLVPSVCEALEGGTDRPQGSGEALRALREAVTSELRIASDCGVTPMVSAEMSSLVEAFRSLVCVSSPSDGTTTAAAARSPA
jgi:hypothetical protein